jgi:hypothetical protein
MANEENKSDSNDARKDAGRDQSKHSTVLNTKIDAEGKIEDANIQQPHSDQEHKPSSRFGRWFEKVHNRLKRVGFHDWVMLAATVVIAISTTLYTVYARGQLDAMQGQLKEMKKSQSSPWVGLEDNVALPDSAPSFYWGPSFPTITMNVRYTLHNYGGAPAFNEQHGIIVLPLDLPQGGGIPPTDKMDLACDYPETLSTHGGAANPGQGQMLLPGARVPEQLGTNLLLDQSKPRKIERLMLMLCFVYQDSSGGIHHSKYWYVTNHDANPTPFILPGHPEWRYWPIRGLRMWGARAD